ncbi:Phage protein [Lactococcus lactis subsp. lactis]|uniref:hypothetical protein n=1 Tax=Lactococcus lactis TaxID=1358 RepID=UPI00071D7B59|nr:hypothetical protein [Lactococcus lactis]ARE11437.1 hypothetical protein LLUC063_1628 [Lactococcus lactis subsp. lactis]KSU33320.1 Phage protein [Lactococcus lactis subsp. lactis]URL08152.1 hypothetical protein L1704_08575 [Lactococcus lactis subsp. lactis]
MNNSYPKSWSRIMTQTIAELNKKKNLTRLDLKRGALALVKGLNVRNKKINAESEADYIKAVWDNFQLYEMALSVIGMLTPQEVIETFPIYKRYDGHKYETKDYFSVQKSLAAYALNQPINTVDDKAFEFLWDYDNDDLVEFTVDFMGAMSHINRLEKGKDLFSQFLEETQGIKSRVIEINGIEVITFDNDDELD